MTKLHRSDDCGNSPKNKMAEEIVISIETKNTEILTPILSNEIIWTLPNRNLKKIDNVLQMVSSGTIPDSIAIDHVISHGKIAAVTGVSNQNGVKTRFCHVIEFTSVKFGKINKIDSYLNS